jgi:AcrR family transcriptional regulator
MTSPSNGRPERRDARENRERLLREAERFFGEHGAGASLQRLAAAAGMGPATLYRHFPSREDLIRALYDRIVERLDAMVEHAEAAGSGWGALVVYVDETLDMFLHSPASPEVMRRMAEIDPGYRPGTRFEEPMTRFVEMAKAEGMLRRDVTDTDVAMLPYAMSGIIRIPDPLRAVVLARFRAVVLDGLRVHDAEALPYSAPGVDELHDAAHHQTEGPLSR